MNPTSLLRDAYRELDDTGSLSRSTLIALHAAGIDPAVMVAADQSLQETEEA